MDASSNCHSPVVMRGKNKGGGRETRVCGSGILCTPEWPVLCFCGLGAVFPCSETERLGIRRIKQQLRPETSSGGEAEDRAPECHRVSRGVARISIGTGTLVKGTGFDECMYVRSIYVCLGWMDANRTNSKENRKTLMVFLSFCEWVRTPGAKGASDAVLKKACELFSSPN